ncbi:hypothetical protein FYJ43_12200 [Cutibacterium sp. WCA-380-WT-3A]|uniref:Uncharacterized protein n=2 Tax=Bacteria TaxID=2 RepID=A0A7K0J9U6_9ACTN|nr:hypothetical protein [Cutibacterium porci]MSS46749.1 hypothetical protein [Cutibacterium porci]
MNRKLEILNLQRQIKADLKILNWSIASFSSKYLIDNNEYDVEEYDVKTFQERVKKQLVRATTNQELLLKYNNFIRNSDEYKKLGDEYAQRDIQPLTGFISDYVALLNEAQDETERKVLAVAAAHALSVGTAWDFHVTPINHDDYYDTRYLTLWEGDIGHGGGSGCWGTAMCEVVQSHWGVLFVRRTDYFFNTGLRTVNEILGFNDGLLKLRGLDYDNVDANNFPSLVYDVELLEQHGVWSLTNKNLVGKKCFNK